MPELPEVETTRRQILRVFAENVRVKRTEVLLAGDKRLRYDVPADLAARVQQARLLALQRRGKYMIFQFESLPPLVVHFGMSGWICVFAAAAKLPVHSHIVFHLNDGRRLVFNDARRFGMIDWARNHSGAVVEDWRDDYRLQRMGVEPLDESNIDAVLKSREVIAKPSTEFNAEYMFSIASSRPSITIKQFLMDYEVVVGVGNIYAAEALFDAKINPRTRARDLDVNDWNRLIDSVQRILLKAILAKGTTFRDFQSGTGEQGQFAVDLKVYGKSTLDACSQCEKPLMVEKISGRTTVYCGACQPIVGKRRRVE